MLERVLLFDENENYITDLDINNIFTEEIEGIDGESRLLFDYPLSQPDVSLITEGRFIAIPDLDGTNEEYLLFEITLLSQNDALLHAECVHDYYSLGKGELVTWNTSGDNASMALSHSLEKEDYQVGKVEIARALGRSVKHVNPLVALRFVEKEWGGELKFRITITGNYKIERYVDLLTRRGAFIGNRFEFGHNLDSFTYTAQTDHIVTAAYGFGREQAVEGEESGGEPITFADVEWSIQDGKAVNKPLGQLYVADENARRKYGRAGKPLTRNTYMTSAVLDFATDSDHGFIKGRTYKFTVLENSKEIYDSTEVAIGDFVTDYSNLDKVFLVIKEIDGYDLMVEAQYSIPKEEVLDYLWLAEDIVRPKGNNGPKRHKFMNYNSGESETAEGLLQATFEQLRQNNYPIINVEGKVSDLGSLDPKFKHERARLGDEHYVIADVMGKPIQMIARIIRFTRRRTNPENNEVELGNFLPAASYTFADIDKKLSMIEQRQGYYDDISGGLDPNAPIEGSRVEGIIDTINAEIHSSLGYVYQTAQGILVLNAPTEAEASKAMLISGGAFFLSNEKNIDGTFNYRTFGDGDGFIADELVAGTIKTDLVEIMGNSYFKWNGDNIYIIDPENSQHQIRMGKYDGEKYGLGFTRDGGKTWNVSLDFYGLHIDVESIEGFDAKVSVKVKEETKVAMDGFKIGVRNLVKNSSFNFGAENWNGGTFPNYAWLQEPEADKINSNIVEFDNASGSTFIGMWSDPILINANGEKEFTLSFDVKVEDLTLNTGHVFGIRTFDDPTKTNASDSLWREYIGQTTEMVNGEWERITFTFTPTTGKYIKLAPYQQGGTSQLSYREIQLEEGNKATSYQIAPEDTAKQLESLATRVTTTEELITDESIVNRVTQSTDFADIMNEKVNAEALAEYTSKLELESALEDVDRETDEKIASIDFTPYALNSDLIQEVDNITAKFEAGGGVNLLLNSIGFADLDFWRATYPSEIRIAQGQIFDPHNYGSGFHFPASTVVRKLEQSVAVMAGQDYTFGWLIKKVNKSTGASNYGAVSFRVVDADNVVLGSFTYNSETVTEGFESNNFIFTPRKSGMVRVEVTANQTAHAYVTALMFSLGDIPFQWTMATGEIYNTNVRSDLNGVRVTRYENNVAVGYSQLSADGIEGYYLATDESGQTYYEKIFYLTEDETVSKKFRAKDEFTMGNVKIVSVNGANKQGWAFVPNVNVEDTEG